MLLLPDHALDKEKMKPLFKARFRKRIDGYSQITMIIGLCISCE